MSVMMSSDVVLDAISPRHRAHLREPMEMSWKSILAGSPHAGLSNQLMWPYTSSAHRSGHTGTDGRAAQRCPPPLSTESIMAETY